MRDDAQAKQLPRVLQWTAQGRAIIFALSAMSIGCLLAEFYNLCPMYTFARYILLPAMAMLALMPLVDRAKGDQQLWRAVLIGAVSGLVAAFVYDLFRLPFVIAAIDKIGPAWLRLPLFKVFPRFGAMILGHPFTATQIDSQFRLTAHLTGWTYHLSNGVTFGIMYMALIGEATRRSWWWAVALAVFLELAMLYSSYTSFFGIPVSARFVVVTLSAHLTFGISLGLFARGYARHWPAAQLVTSPAR